MCSSDKNISPAVSDTLLEESKTWSATEWESYLSSLEVQRRETLTRKYDDLVESLVTDPSEGPQFNETALERLQSAIALLSPKQAAVVRAKFWEGLSEREIAKRYGMARTTVQMHLFRATAHLKALMSSKFPLSERAKSLFPHNACPDRTETESERDE